MVTQLRLTATSLGLDFGKRTRTYNSRLAQELGLWAEAKNAGEQFHMKTFSAYFSKGLNIAKQEVLLDICSNIGLPTNEAKEILLNRLYKNQVDKDWNESRKLQICGVPTILLGNKKLTGAHPYSKFVELLENNHIKKRER